MSWVNLLDIVYPIGAVYFSRNSTSPASVIGGTWTQIKGALLGAIGDDIEEGYNGSLKITTSQMPSHSHNPYQASTKDEPSFMVMKKDNPGIAEGKSWNADSETNDSYYSIYWYGDKSDVWTTSVTANTGGGAKLFALQFWSLYLVQNCLVGGLNG